MTERTDFQIECEKRLSDFLNLDTSVETVSREMLGEREKYIHIKLNLRNVEIWIYGRECMFACAGNDVHFESADYADEERLIEDFLKSLRECLAGKDVSSAGSAFLKLFTGKDL